MRENALCDVILVQGKLGNAAPLLIPTRTHPLEETEEK